MKLQIVGDEVQDKSEGKAFEQSIAVIGAGNMGGAIVRGLLRAGCPADKLAILESSREKAQMVAADSGVRVLDEARELSGYDLIVLAVKPQVLPEVSLNIAAVLPKSEKRIIVSIAAGVPLDAISDLFQGKGQAVRVMPNLPCAVFEGVSAVYSEDHAAGDIAEKVFSTVGETVRLPSEDLFDVVTALSGSGPAYVFLMIEALADGAVKHGLSRAMATKLAAQTMRGAAGLLLQSGECPGALREKVASPGGTTIYGLQALEDSGVRAALMRAVEAATWRSSEMSRM
ncbi:MAG: pyrroline-5-carboxylate reductase [bacterium]|nr:pyrroline-5-carboxylate reductase [bacterium]